MNQVLFFVKPCTGFTGCFSVAGFFVYWGAMAANARWIGGGLAAVCGCFAAQLDVFTCNGAPLT